MVSSKATFPKWISVIFFFQFLMFIVISYSKNDKSLIYWGLLLIPLGISFILFYLEVNINDSEIAYKFFLFPKKCIHFSEISNIEFVKTNIFLGYGISLSKKYGLGYILDTEQALCITRKDGKRVTLSIINNNKIIDFIKSSKWNSILK